MTRWNIFASELEDILANHKLRLSQLSNHTGIHREKVRRLRQSLARPKSFPVLNRAEMDLLINALLLDSFEVIRLRAAIIAASIEEMLMERIDRENAYIAIEQIFPTIMIALDSHKDDQRGLGTMRGDDDPLLPEEWEGEHILEPTLYAIDRATKALHLSRNGETFERIERLQQAAIGFETAQTLLAKLEDPIKLSEEWQFWFTEAQNGLSVVNQYLKKLNKTIG